MKNVLLMTLVAISLIACDDDSNDPNPNVQAQISEVKSVAQEGQWVVTYFWDTDKDETSDFAGYAFVFGSNGAVTATKSATEVSGQWSVTSDDSSDDDDNDSLDDVDFNLSFSTPSSFEELSEDWEILSMTSTKIELKHVSGGNGGTDFLTFEKD
jgi:hypothetical protein